MKKKVKDKADDKKIKSKLTKEKDVKDSSKDKSEESKK